MTVSIKKGKAGGEIKAPPSKSFAHRQIICAALSGGKSSVGNICDSDDISATVDCARSLGAEITVEHDTAYIKPGGVVKNELFCRQSGSTIRFFIPVCLAAGGEFMLHGDKRLLQRPFEAYKDLCAAQGVIFEQTEEYIRVKGKLDLSDVTVSGAVSSQFITGLMLAAPLSGKDSVIHIKPPFVSRPYVDITAAVMADFGVTAVFEDEYTLKIKGGSYKPADVIAEGDWSNGAFLYALNALGGDVTVTGLNENSPQGDRVILKQLEALKNGCAEIDITDCPDNAPILTAVAAANNGCTLYGTSRLKIKESDRGAAMAEELSKFGVKVEVYDDKITVSHGLKKPKEKLFGHNDHRIVMSCACLLTLTGGQIDGAEAVNKSYPGFFKDISSLGIKITQG
jgi:3-phosphoshikimate 1-carboxyvinyltransferase